MLSLLLLICFRIHTNYKQKRIQQKSLDCGTITSQIGPNSDWMSPAPQAVQIECHGDPQTPIQSITLGGAGLFRVKNPALNILPRGLIDIENANLDCTMSKVYSSGVASSKIQLISLQGAGDHSFIGTTFEFCGVYPWGYINDQHEELPDDWDPSLIFINGSSTNSFDNVKFTHPDSGSIQGWELRQTRPIRVEGDCSLFYTSGSFYNSTLYYTGGKGAFLSFDTTKEIYISDCTFRECHNIDVNKDQKNSCHAVYISEKSTENVTINKSKFIDCGKNNKGYVIESKAAAFIFTTNEITFSSSNSSGCVKCVNKGTYIFIGNTFSNAEENTDDWTGVAIYIQGTNNNQPEHLEFDGNTFENIRGPNQGRCLSADLKDGTFTSLNNNKILNCPKGGFFIKVMQRTAITEFTISGWQFINNAVSPDHFHPYGGGAGIWVENPQINNQYTDPFNLTIDNCKFINNYSSERGGAFQVGSYTDREDMDKYVTRVKVTINNCEFINNTAQRGGGAVSISTNFPLVINSCKFENNKINNSINAIDKKEFGGAIFIDTNVVDQSGNNQQMPSVTITSCTFTGNSGQKSHCIHMKNGPNTIIDINSCTFENNHDENYKSGSCILSDAFQLTVTDCKFNNNDLGHSSGGINVTSTCILEVTKSKFIHCTAGNISNSYGGGIAYASINDDHGRDESITIKDCEFDGCSGANGVAIGLKPYKSYPVISDIKIKNHVLTNWIFFIFFQFETEGDFSLNKVEFENNSFDSAKNSEFGGGTGIWIAESEDINYDNAFNLVFNECNFLYNFSPENGGAISYGGSARLQSIELTFISCDFNYNRCDHYFGGACRFETRKPVSLISCNFNGNKAERQSSTGGSGGGAVFIGSTVESVLISGCEFMNCTAYRGSFIFTNGAMKDMNISKCTFSNLISSQDNSVYIEVDSQITNFVFDSNTFRELHCDGPDGGAGLHIFNGADCVVSNCQFENCASSSESNEKNGVIRINEIVNTNSLLIFSLCTFNNDKGEGKEGERAICIAQESSVQFNSCNFIGYDKSDTIDGIILYSESKSSTIFYNCSFSEVKGKSVMNMVNAISADISDCQFTSCTATETLISAESATNFTISNNLFSNNKGSIKFGELVETGLIYNNTFQGCSATNGGALYINGDTVLSMIEIKDNDFTKCSATNGLAIYITDRVKSVDIHDCKFTDNNGDSGYTIDSKAKALTFTDSIIQYENEDFKGCGIKIESPCEAQIFNIEFKNFHRPSAIYIKKTNTDDKDQSFIYNCSFTGFRPLGNSPNDESYSAFCFEVDTINFYNNTIKNHQNYKEGWPNLLIGKIGQRIENCTFISNRVGAKDNCGGAGLKFSDTNTNKQIVNCYFENNEAKLNSNNGGTGGAIHFGQDEIEIDGCSFINNRADCEGGALSITCTNAYIHDSIFTNNYAAQQSFGNSTSNNKMGGAIYFDSNKNGCFNLTKCIFKQNTADQNGHALYICGTTPVYISDHCYFEDNSRVNGGAQIFVNADHRQDGYQNLDFSNSTVCLKNQTTKSRGIELLSGVLYAHHTTFTNIQASKQDTKIEGNAILVNRDVINNNNNAIIENNLFKDCYIDDKRSYAVTFNGTELNFRNNTFDFSKGKGCGCLRIYTTGKVNVENNTFQNANTPSQFHGVFIYEELYRTSEKDHAVIRFNTFQKCTSLQTACFQFKWVSQDYEFIDNTFQNNDLASYLGEFDFMGKKINGEFYCGGNKFINNTGKSLYGGGAGLWFQNKPQMNDLSVDQRYTLTIDGCLFSGNHAVHNQEDKRNYKNGNGGAIQFGHTESVSNINLIIINSQFINNIADLKGGALSIQIIGYSKIDNCTFEGNKAGQNPSSSNEIYGGAIWIWADFNWDPGHYTILNGDVPIYSDNITIVNSKFNNNQAKDATAVYMQSSQHTDLFITGSQFVGNCNQAYKNFSIVSAAKEFIFENSKIEFANRDKASSGIRTAGPTKIITSHFIKTCVYDANSAEALYVENDANEIEVDNSIFENCGNRGGEYCAIKIFTNYANVHNSIFNYTDNTMAARVIRIRKHCNIRFYKNRITKSQSDGAFHYDPINGNKNNEYIHIENCIFEKCNGINTRCLDVKLYTQNYTFYNNTIQDCPLISNKGYILAFYLKSPSITEFIMDQIVFRNLQTGSPYGGGSGIWIQHTEKYKLVFQNCTFENNHAHQTQVFKDCDNGKGGAIQYGWSESISKVDLSFEGCNFTRNKADQDGGALCLMIQGNIEIYECAFTDNTAGLNQTGNYYGGAISIIPEYGYEQVYASDSIRINKCIFSGNNGRNANAIYVSRGPRTDLIIENGCQFLDNTNESSTVSTIMAETRKFEVDDSVFDFSSLSKSCNAISTNATTFILDSTKFTHCLFSKNKGGSALIIREGTTLCNIRNSQFIDNGKNNKGCVIYSEAANFIYQGNLIDFTDMAISDRGMYIHYPCKFHLSDSTFHHCKTPDSTTGAAFVYNQFDTKKAGYTEDISFNNLTFDNNSCGYASCFYMRPITIPILRNIKVLNHKDNGGFVTVIVFPNNLRQDITLEKWTFDNNLYNKAKVDTKKQDCGGIGLWIAAAEKSSGYKESFKLTFDTCVFKNNRNNLCGGAFAYGYSDTLRYIFVNFNDCTFENNLCDGENGGALCFNGQVPVTIERSIFRGNKVSSGSYKGHCIYIDRRCKAIISETQFIDNGLFGNELIAHQKHSGQSIIQCSGAQLDMNKCNITFTDPSIINSRCIDIDYQSVVNLINSTFSNVNVGKIWGGALHLWKNETSIVDEQITIDSCVFDNNYADNGCSGLFWATSIPTLINLSFKNQPNGKYVFCIFFLAFRDTCTVESTVFENGTSPSKGEDGGGSAIWIANQEDISHGRPFELIFHNCTWQNNAANKRGGAIHYGTSKTLVGVQMTFDKCHFLNNHAKEEGGAVSLETKSPIVFSDCTFRNNYVESAQARASTSGTKGGSISVNSKTPLVQIHGCSFTNETSDEGNAIFIHNNVQACSISGCTFKSCGKTGTAIVSETPEFMLFFTEISFDRRQSCRALELRTISVTTISQCTFSKCHTTGVGAGIYLNNTLESEEQEDFTLMDCIFDACEADTDGSAMFLNVSSAPVLRGNTFQNHKNDKNVSVILNYYDFQDLFSVQSCTFKKNQFQNTRFQDGGGCAMFIANCKISLESLYKLSFEDCTWSDNSAAYGGAFSYGNNNLVKNVEHVFERCTFNSNQASNDKGGALYLTTTQMILFDGCTFYNNKCHNPDSTQGKQGGAVYISKCSSISLTATTFTNNYANNGHAIFIEDIPSANIFGCTFDSNSNTQQREGSQIASKCAELVLYDTTLKFDGKRIPARGIEIFKQCSTSFVNCKFLNCNISQEGGAIRIREDLVTNRTEALTLDNCIFDKCDSSNGAAINAYISCNPTIKGCRISNSNKGNYIFCIFFHSVPAQQRFVQIDDCTFEGNYFKGASTSDAGGIGLWIAYRQELSAEELTLRFNRCNFISNLCGKNGGAFAYGESKTLKNISLTFADCTFKNNSCNGGRGGALYISTEKPLTITSCHFINNKCNGANTVGSAIYINSPSEKVHILDSTFEGGQSINGVGVYSESSTTNLVIESSSFANCASSSTGSVIYSKASSFSFQQSNITFDLETTVKCRGIFLENKAKVLISNNRFINCQSSGVGGALNINLNGGNKEESLEIRDVIIQNADASNGCAMMVKTNLAPTLDHITIKNCTSGHYVVTVFFNTYVYEAKLSHCSFEYNQFSNNAYPPNPDGGGSGIWIANDGLRDDNKDKRLIFDDCTWIGNRVQAGSSLKYGGAFAYGTSLTTKQTELVFESCRFIQNSASDRGGALYLCTSLPVKLSHCLLDENEAADGASIYAETTSNVTIEYTQIARNKATQNGAAYIKSSQNLQMLNVTFSANSGPTATSLYLENEGSANIENCNFDFSRSQNQYQIRLHGSSTSASITFRMGCFVHSGDNNGNTHIYSTHKGAVNLPSGNCFDTSQSIAINNQGGSINAGSGIFDCNKCGNIYVPTLAPEPTPTASPAIETSIPSEVPSQIPTTSSSQSSGSSSSSNKKKNTKTIAMIAGITAAIVVVIVVIIILIWLFVCRKRSGAAENNSDNASEMNDEQITEISGIDPTGGADDPIWAGTNQDNPLFNGGDDQDEDQMIHNDFEESWGDSVI